MVGKVKKIGNSGKHISLQPYQQLYWYKLKQKTNNLYKKYIKNYEKHKSILIVDML